MNAVSNARRATRGRRRQSNLIYETCSFFASRGWSVSRAILSLNKNWLFGVKGMNGLLLSEAVSCWSRAAASTRLVIGAIDQYQSAHRRLQLMIARPVSGMGRTAEFYGIYTAPTFALLGSILNGRRRQALEFSDVASEPNRDDRGAATASFRPPRVTRRSRSRRALQSRRRP